MGEDGLFKKSVLGCLDVFGFFLRVVLGVSEENSTSLQGFWLGTLTENVARVSIKLSVQSD